MDILTAILVIVFVGAAIRYAVIWFGGDEAETPSWIDAVCASMWATVAGRLVMWLLPNMSTLATIGVRLGVYVVVLGLMMRWWFKVPLVRALPLSVVVTFLILLRTFWAIVSMPKSTP